MGCRSTIWEGGDLNVSHHHRGTADRGRAHGGRRGQDVRRHQSGHRQPPGDRGRSRCGGRRPRRGIGRPCIRDLGCDVTGHSRTGDASIRQHRRGACRGAGDARVPQRGHADLGRTWAAGDDRGCDPVLRGRGGQVLRPHDPGRAGRSGDDVPRTDRCGGVDHALELPPQHRQLEGCAGAGRGQHRGAEAGQPDAAVGAALRRAGGRSRSAGGRVERRAGARVERGRRAGRPSRRGQDRLHRVDRGGCQHRPQSGGDHQAGDARAGRQVRLRGVRRRRPREGGRDGAVRGVRELRPGLLRALAVAGRGVGQGRAARALCRDHRGDPRRHAGRPRDAGRPADLGRTARDRQALHRNRGRRGRAHASRAANGRRGSWRTATSCGRRCSTAAPTR